MTHTTRLNRLQYSKRCVWNDYSYEDKQWCYEIKLARYSDECEYIADICQSVSFLHKLCKGLYEPIANSIDFNCPIGQYNE